MSYLAITDKEFECTVTLQETYLIMARFAANYLARADTSIADFLHAYAAVVARGKTTDPAAAYDFLAATNQVLSNHGGSQ